MGKTTTSAKSGINLYYDRDSQDYYVTWEPVVIGFGKTKDIALEDLRKAAHFCVDSLIDIKLKDVTGRKE